MKIKTLFVVGFVVKLSGCASMIMERYIGSTVAEAVF